MKQLTLMMLVILWQLGGPVWAAEETTAVVLQDVEVISGGHCESSAIHNALHYLGYDIDETIVAGGGGAPSFLFLKGQFPFLGGRNSNMREVFFEGAGIPWHLVKPEKQTEPWNNITSLLKQEKTISFSLQFH